MYYSVEAYKTYIDSQNWKRSIEKFFQVTMAILYFCTWTSLNIAVM